MWVQYGLARDRPQRLCQYIGDSAKMAGNRCSNCVAFDSECTHLFMNQVRSYTLSFPPKIPDFTKEKRDSIQVSAPFPKPSNYSYLRISNPGQRLSCQAIQTAA